MNVRVVGTRYIAAFTHVVQSHLSVGAVNNIAQEFFWMVNFCVYMLVRFVGSDTDLFVCVCTVLCVYLNVFSCYYPVRLPLFMFLYSVSFIIL